MIILLIYLFLHILINYVLVKEDKAQVINKKSLSFKDYFEGFIFTSGALMLPIGIAWFSFDVFEYFSGEKHYWNEGNDYYYENGNFGEICAIIFQVTSILFLSLYYKKKGRNLHSITLLIFVSIIVFGVAFLIINSSKSYNSNPW